MDAPNALQRKCEIEKRVTAVLDMIDYNTGNIHRLIAEDLASPAAEDDLALLPILCVHVDDNRRDLSASPIQKN